MNEIEKAIGLSSNIEHLGVVGILFLAVLFLAFLLKDKKQIEILMNRLALSCEQMVEINKKYQSYYEKLLEENLKKESKNLEIQNEILKEIRQNREFYQSELKKVRNND